jgi:hypothetical protein
MEARLSEKIEGRCEGLERRVAEAEQCNEERLISLEMARTESESGWVDMEKRVDGLKMEIHHFNLFLEHENPEHRDQPHIISTKESVALAPTPGTTVDCPDGHRIELQHRDNEFGLISSHAHVPVNGTLPPKHQSPNTALLHEYRPNRQSTAYVESVRASQGCLTKVHFPVFNGEDPQLW